MGWDEFLFKHVYRSVQKVFSEEKKPILEKRKVHLSSVKDRLSILAKSLTGENIEIFSAEREGGFQNNVFFLPSEYSAGSKVEENIHFYIYRILYLSEQKRLGLNWKPGEERTRTESLQKALENHSFLLENLRNSYPGANELFDSVIANEIGFRRLNGHVKNGDEDLSFLHGIWMSPSIQGSGPRDLKTKATKSQKEEILTELSGIAREKIRTLEVDQKSQQDYTLQHQFEKVDTIEEFSGTWRDFDGTDSLEEQKEALQELDLRDTVRSDEPTHSVFHTEFLSGFGIAESNEILSEEKPVRYDEWDFGKRKYRIDYCSVYPKKLIEKDPQFTSNVFREYFSTLNLMRSRLNRFANERMAIHRQSEGEELDLDALLDFHTDIRSGHIPSENVYLSKRKKLREVSILVLTDTSLSTDSYVDNQRILDVEKISLLLFGQICSEFGDRFQMDSFSSRTRNHCDYFSVKGFDESWEKARDRIGAMQSNGYTRIGPAIRHGLSQIRKEATSRRWILLLTDGKPNDYDRYEGKYGIEDVKQAIRECEVANIGLFALAIDRQSKRYLPTMLGLSSYKILPNPTHLPEALADFYMKLVR
ncbi:VWA domain-containing protein [Leptospira langatensis]|uniref:VWA domain-containing protein n=1 Tax=Leptospira langatensis TaxID=2484983 RepID=A0A5F1ZNI1_9LEPT|nr:VWA domain-containing protein [Leptospira langatensis]TGK05210.1 VWA domain-containing protein [Leptospira langatensis]TGL38345.1 VWA domain-containing protein [Leptospira langatensis]